MTADNQEFQGNITQKKTRIKSGALNAEREAVLKILNDNPDAQPLALATDLDIPEERVIEYWVEWHSRSVKKRVVRFSKLTGILKGFFKTTAGEPLAGDTPMKMEFEDNRVIITPYEKSVRV